MLQFIDARLQTITAEVTNGLVRDENPNGSGRDAGGGGRRGLHAAIPPWDHQASPKRRPGPENNAGVVCLVPAEPAACSARDV